MESDLMLAQFSHLLWTGLGSGCETGRHNGKTCSGDSGVHGETLSSAEDKCPLDFLVLF